jgi:non-specific protein-tyrosine kinase
MGDGSDGNRKIAFKDLISKVRRGSGNKIEGEPSGAGIDEPDGETVETPKENMFPDIEHFEPVEALSRAEEEKLHFDGEVQFVSEFGTDPENDTLLNAAVDENSYPHSESEVAEAVEVDDMNANEKVALKENPVEVNEKSSREGWISPNYDTSKKIKLDYKVAARNRCVCLFPDLPYVEHYKMLRTQVQQRCVEKGWNTIMVTSVCPGEGKTLTAVNLSVVLAREFDQTVLLVDADLRKQQVHKYMGYQAPYSLVDYLETDMPLSEVIVWPGVEKLTVISGDNTVNDSTEILGSPRMGSLVEEMKTRYPKRYIIFDVPPVLDHADATTFAPLVDGILVVVEPGKTDLKDILKMTELLPKEKIIGYAMNRVGKQKNV